MALAGITLDQMWDEDKWGINRYVGRLRCFCYPLYSMHFLRLQVLFDFQFERHYSFDGG